MADCILGSYSEIEAHFYCFPLVKSDPVVNRAYFVSLDQLLGCLSRQMVTRYYNLPVSRDSAPRNGSLERSKLQPRPIDEKHTSFYHTVGADLNLLWR